MDSATLDGFDRSEVDHEVPASHAGHGKCKDEKDKCSHKGAYPRAGAGGHLCCHQRMPRYSHDLWNLTFSCLSLKNTVTHIQT